jgi:prenyltransferase beta subunit
MQARSSVSHANARGGPGGQAVLWRLATPLPHAVTDPEDAHPSAALFDVLALQFWILAACQDVKGLRDKPGKRPDFYHTCYCLSGLAVSQQTSGLALGGGARNALAQTDPRLNVPPAKLQRARSYFAQQGPPP